MQGMRMVGELGGAGLKTASIPTVKHQRIPTLWIQPYLLSKCLGYDLGVSRTFSDSLWIHRAINVEAIPTIPIEKHLVDPLELGFK